MAPHGRGAVRVLLLAGCVYYCMAMNTFVTASVEPSFVPRFISSVFSVNVANGTSLVCEKSLNSSIAFASSSNIKELEFDKSSCTYKAALTMTEWDDTLNIIVDDTIVKTKQVFALPPFSSTSTFFQSDETGASSTNAASLSISGDWLLYGHAARPAYFFSRDVNGWEIFSSVSAQDADSDLFGVANSVSGTFAFLGDAASSRAAPSGGCVEFLHWTDAQWARECEIAPALLRSGDGFGASVAATGATLLASAPARTVGGVDAAGAVFFFIRSSGEWTETQEITQPAPQAAERFGDTLDLCGDLLVVSGATTKIHTFEYDSGVWEFAATISASGAPSALFFAAGSLFVGVAAEGAVFEYERSGAGWAGVGTVVPESALPRFGQSICVQDNLLIVADNATSSTASAGGISLFARNAEKASGWEFLSRLGAETCAFSSAAPIVANAVDAVVVSIANSTAPFLLQIEHCKSGPARAVYKSYDANEGTYVNLQILNSDAQPISDSLLFDVSADGSSWSSPDMNETGGLYTLLPVRPNSDPFFVRIHACMHLMASITDFVIKAVALEKVSAIEVDRHEIQLGEDADIQLFLCGEDDSQISQFRPVQACWSSESCAYAFISDDSTLHASLPALVESGTRNLTFIVSISPRMDASLSVQMDLISGPPAYFTFAPAIVSPQSSVNMTLRLFNEFGVQITEELTVYSAFSMKTPILRLFDPERAAYYGVHEVIGAEPGVLVVVADNVRLTETLDMRFQIWKFLSFIVIALSIPVSFLLFFQFLRSPQSWSTTALAA
eukprot:gnl/Chilomastix_cuspidata/579.p1 GENE.gnl/Chilomastix_cuspidata/579~~gnl/Chilomastix_cuspidata/579.p1  ORF type:complete len:787 (-),score=129.87 gnl/Chilomastix_cuspidata/579:200-2560(-)